MPPLNQAVTVKFAPATFGHVLQIGEIAPNILQSACKCPNSPDKFRQAFGFTENETKSPGQHNNNIRRIVSSADIELFQKIRK